MVSALLNDALADPRAVIRSLHAEHAPAAAPPLATRVAQHFRAVLGGDDALSQVCPLPAVDPSRAASPRLVRFRAMVQDTSASPEMYPAVLPDGSPGGWGFADTDAAPEDLMQVQHLCEREVLWAISIPGESPFVAKLLDGPEAPWIKISASTLLHKDPLARVDHTGVQIKLYDPSAAPFRPTDLHTFVGLLTHEHLSSGEQVPTLHVLFSVKHDPALVLLRHSVQQDPPAAALKDELVQWVADAALGGDRDAALWVLLAAVARVQSHHPPLLPPSLTISKFPCPHGDAPAPALTRVLPLLLPLFVDLPLSLPLINTRPFSPESRDESLHAGMLQLPPGTAVLLSDSGVEEGNFTAGGVANIQTLRDAITTQTLEYYFPFTTPYPFPTDLSFIFLTEGASCGLFETRVNVPLQCAHPHSCFQPPEDIREPPADRLDAFRRLLAGASTGQVEITDHVSKHIQDDFVRERQVDKTVTPDDLMTRISVARVLALLLHSPVLTVEAWQEAKELDQRRKLRF